MADRRRFVLAVSAVLMAATAATWLTANPAATPSVTFEPARSEAQWPALSTDARADALRRMTVWRDPEPFSSVIPAQPAHADGVLSQPLVSCRYLSSPPHGTTPKFDCVLPDGEVVKVKYGRSLEIQAELAASRLLRIVGLGADRMYLIPRLRCYGCPPSPFYLTRALDIVGAQGWWERHPVAGWSTDFDWVAIERRFQGLPIEGAEGQKGWAWFELRQVDPRLGATRAEIDAFRLMALFLAHWDNKMENQRLVCLSDVVPSEPRSCPRPFALIHDLGSTFGPRKINLNTWQRTPIWRDRRTCSAGMRALPYHGGTFEDVVISEEGRRMFLERIGILNEAQVTSIFAGARFEASHRFSSEQPVAAWVKAFLARVEDVKNAGPCAM